MSYVKPHLPLRVLVDDIIQAGGLPNINIVQIRNGEPNVVNQRPGFDRDDVSVRAKGFIWMINKFQHLVRRFRAFSRFHLILFKSSQIWISP